MADAQDSAEHLTTELLGEFLDLDDAQWNASILAASGVEAQCGNAGARLPPQGLAASAFRQLAIAPGDDAQPGTRRKGRQQPLPPALPEPLREQDRLLPVANVAKLMTAELARDAKISRDAKLFMQEMVSEFICFVASESNDFCKAENQKAISQDDLLNAFDSLDFGCYVPVLEAAAKELPGCRSRAGTSVSHEDSRKNRKLLQVAEDGQQIQQMQQMQQMDQAMPQAQQEANLSACTTRVVTPKTSFSPLYEAQHVCAVGAPLIKNQSLPHAVEWMDHHPVIATAIPIPPGVPSPLHLPSAPLLGPSPLLQSTAPLMAQSFSPSVLPSHAMRSSTDSTKTVSTDAAGMYYPGPSRPHIYVRRQGARWSYALPDDTCAPA